MAAKMERPKKSAPEEAVVGQELADTIDDCLERLLAPIARLEELKRREYLTPEEVVVVYGLGLSTLANKRMRAQGPEYIKVGEKILYKQKDIKKYLEAKAIRTRM